MKDALQDYRAKRDFGRTGEPAGGESPGSGEPVFVIQKHAARRLHYDFRLEVDGVLKSWAVPKGPSLNPRDKRLAVPTEDHPREYAEFEGVIPPGEYGAGTVMVWDRGTYRNLTDKKGVPVSMDQALEHGHAVIWLEGAKLRGGYALTRFKRTPEEAWLLVKVDDEHADPSRDVLADRPDSALSGRNLDQISAAGSE